MFMWCWVRFVRFGETLFYKIAGDVYSSSFFFHFLFVCLIYLFGRQDYIPEVGITIEALFLFALIL